MSYKVVILGSSGFVGRNLLNCLVTNFDVVVTSRDEQAQKADVLFFDLNEQETWGNVLDVGADVVINCMGYGVVKTETDIDSIYNTNYLNLTNFYGELFKKSSSTAVVHIGTAFEYDLNAGAVTESTVELPRTHYGISKLMASKYLLSNRPKDSIVIRPFNMFGPFEHSSKIIPALILSQKHKQKIPLSSGSQKRDYLFVQDLTDFISSILPVTDDVKSGPLVNVGSGKSLSLRALASELSELLPDYDDSLWMWGALPDRANESAEFYNASELAVQSGLKRTSMSLGLKKTIEYYWNYDV